MDFLESIVHLLVAAAGGCGLVLLLAVVFALLWSWAFGGSSRHPGTLREAADPASPSEGLSGWRGPGSRPPNPPAG